jgi:hypothetical protein
VAAHPTPLYFCVQALTESGSITTAEEAGPHPNLCLRTAVVVTKAGLALHLALTLTLILVLTLTLTLTLTSTLVRWLST